MAENNSTADTNSNHHFNLVSLDVSSAKGPLFSTGCCVFTMMFQEWSYYIKVNLTAEGELAARTAFPGPSCPLGRHMATTPLVGLQQLELEPLPATFHQCPAEVRRIPEGRTEEEKASSRLCCVHLRTWDKACPRLHLCSLPQIVD